MKINKLTASFGKLQNETLSLHDGLNVIYAPNESGKSTWCAFIQAMLYGIDSSSRVKDGYLPDKLRYAPWSGAPMEGTMELRANHCDITVTRSTKAKGSPMKEFSAVYTGTNTPVEGMNGTNAGELLTGVSKDVFRRSAFIAQGTMAVSGSPELEKRIGAIVTTGEEEISYTESCERLRAWQRKRRYNKRGYIPELESRIEETQQKLNEMDGSFEDMEQLEKKLETARKECSRLEAAVAESRRKQRKEALDRLSKGAEELKRRSDEHDRSLNELSCCREELRKNAFYPKPLAELTAQVRNDLEELSALQIHKRSRLAPLGAFAFFVLALVFAVLQTRLEKPLFMVFAIIFGIAALVLMIIYNAGKRRENETREERIRILKSYKARSPEEISDALNRYRELIQAALEAENAEKQTRAEYEKAKLSQEALKNGALMELDFTSGNSEAARLGRQLQAARTEAERLNHQIAALNGRLSAMGDPLVLSSSLGTMTELRDELNDEYDAISLAIDTLRQADEELQTLFAPELGRLAASYMSAVTGGRYTDVLINRDLSAKTRTADDALARDSEYLSAGTLDIMYLAVRLAVCELALPEGKNCPLILDDALVNLDETRLSQAMELLGEIAKTRQVILFSCRK